MFPPHKPKPPAAPPAARQQPSRTAPAAAPAQPPRSTVPTGRVRHDERGNAVWDWIKDTGHHALDSTSRLLKKLEVPHLETEDAQDERLRAQTDRRGGGAGGYDPYNQTRAPRSGPRGR